MTALRPLAAHALYTLGGAVLRLGDATRLTSVSGVPYRIYSVLMGWSSDAQDDGPGPWAPVEAASLLEKVRR